MTANPIIHIPPIPIRSRVPTAGEYQPHGRAVGHGAALAAVDTASVPGAGPRQPGSSGWRVVAEIGRSGRDVSGEVARRLAARARQRGAVLVPVGDWPAPDLVPDAAAGPWLAGEGEQPPAS
jgi:hypothetical protein